MCRTLVRTGSFIVMMGLATGGQAQTPRETLEVAEWLDAVDGDWSDASNWSTDVFPDNGTPLPEKRYEARIDAVGTPYTVTLDRDVTVDGLVLDSPDATLQQRTLSFALLGGVRAEAGVFDVTAGTLTLGGNSLIGDGAELRIGGGSTLASDGDAALNVGGRFVNEGIIRPGGGGRLTLGAAAGGSLVNEGTLVIDDDATALIAFQSGVVNNGLIRVLGGTLQLGGTVEADRLGDVIREGGAVELVGLLANSGQTFSLADRTGRLDLVGGTIFGGTVVGNRGARVVIQPSPHTTSRLRGGVTLDTPVEQLGDVAVRDGLELRQPWRARSGSILLEESQSFNGPGPISFESTGVPHARIDTGRHTLTTGDQLVVRTAGGDGLVTGNAFAGALINGGLLSGQGAGRTLTVAAVPVTNAGTLRAIDGGTLRIENLRGPAGNLVIANGGHLDLDGDFTIDQDLAAEGSILSLRGDW